MKCGVGMIDEPGNCDEYVEEPYGESDTDSMAVPAAIRSENESEGDGGGCPAVAAVAAQCPMAPVSRMGTADSSSVVTTRKAAAMRVPRPRVGPGCTDSAVWSSTAMMCHGGPDARFGDPYRRALGEPGIGFCGMSVGSPGVELTNSTSQVIISRLGDRTTLTMAPNYEGDATDFVMLVPVPVVLEEDDIRTARPELFQRLNDYSAPRVVEYACSDFEWDDEVPIDDGPADDGPGDDGWEEEPGGGEADYSHGICL